MCVQILYVHNIFNLFQLLYYLELLALKYLKIKHIALEALLADSMKIHQKFPNYINWNYEDLMCCLTTNMKRKYGVVYALNM